MPVSGRDNLSDHIIGSLLCRFTDCSISKEAERQTQKVLRAHAHEEEKLVYSLYYSWNGNTKIAFSLNLIDPLFLNWDGTQNIFLKYFACTTLVKQTDGARDVRMPIALVISRETKIG